MSFDPKAHGWKEVVFAADAEANDDMCPICGDVDFGDCPCPGPTMDDHEYEVFNGILHARLTLGRWLELMT